MILTFMTNTELASIKESIERIERFPMGFPKRVECSDARWQTFFDLQYEWCVSQRNRLSPDKPEEQMKLVV